MKLKGKLLTTPLVYAATDLGDAFTPSKSLGSNPTFSSILSPIIQNITIVAGLAAFIASLLAGFRYITAGGNPKETQKASSMLLFSLLGLALAVIAFWITRILFEVGGLPIF